MKSAESYAEIVLNSNKAAIQLLKIDDFSSAKPYLDTSMQILNSKKVKNSKKLLPITLNNYGCYFKRLGYLQESLDFFKQALEKSDYKGSNVTETYLNISNVLYQSANYPEALRAGLKALESLKKENSKTAVQVYEMLGSIYKLMGLGKEAQSMYLKGLIISHKVLGNSHKLTKNLEKEYDEFRKDKGIEGMHKNKNRCNEDKQLNSLLVHEFIPMPVDYSALYGEIPERTLKNYEIKAKLVGPTTTQARIPRGVSQKYYKFSRVNLENSRLKRRKEILTPIPKRNKLSLSSPRFNR